MLFYRTIANHTDYAQLQEDINTISEWVDGNYLQFNTQKCKFMRVTRKQTGIRPPTLYLRCQPLQEVDSCKYLVILLSSDLSWSQHTHTSSFYNSFVRYTTGICSLHMYPCVFLLLYHLLKLTSGHTCKISYCTAILCVLASMLKPFIKKKQKKA